jgi:hypothetical protein
MQRVFRRWIGALGSGLLASFLLLTNNSPARGETAVLECVADAVTSAGSIATKTREMKLPGVIFISFRTWNVTRWKVDSATLLLHIASGAAPTTVEIASIPEKWGEIEPPKFDAAKLKFVSLKTSAEPENWLAMEVPGGLVEDSAANRAHGFAIRFKPTRELVVHARESGTFSPYLIVTGALR